MKQLKNKTNKTSNVPSASPIVEKVSKIFKIAVKYILSPGKQPERVMARSVLAYWAVGELGNSHS